MRRNLGWPWAVAEELGVGVEEEEALAEAETEAEVIWDHLIFRPALRGTRDVHRGLISKGGVVAAAAGVTVEDGATVAAAAVATMEAL